ncbi:uncharacterized protein C14orf119 homolog [Chironomus tepperi]|uniref:uncharacterized protein C14orf119 homolog n=1 Tax=Chironomus tepperi TaxID=113505 RepID=UPI00391F4E50
MNHSHLSPEVEFRYLITWFREFSEYERSDFMEILIQWLLKPNEIYMNGMTESSQKPTIFYCRMKLFKEWSLKWPDQLRSRLIDKLNELDSDFGQKLNENLEARLEQVDDVQSKEVESIQNGMTELTVEQAVAAEE